MPEDLVRLLVKFGPDLTNDGADRGVVDSVTRIANRFRVSV